MIIRPQARPQSFLRALARPSLSASRGQHRSLTHTVPALPNQEDWETNGIAGLISAEVFRTNWVDYQTHLCNVLNKKTQGTVDEDLHPRALLGKYSHDPSQAALFNTASQAVNNFFFFEALSSTITDPSEHKALMSEILASFEDLKHLQHEMLEAAMAMFGNGYIWLMKDDTSNLRILCTYNAGSPFKEAHWRAQYRDMANASLSDRLTRPQNLVGMMGDYSANRAPYASGTLQAQPILCLNNWQHMWIKDYGLLNKETYVMSWWYRINWAVVAMRSNLATQESSSFGSSRGRLMAKTARQSYAI